MEGGTTNRMGTGYAITLLTWLRRKKKHDCTSVSSTTDQVSGRLQCHSELSWHVVATRMRSLMYRRRQRPKKYLFYSNPKEKTRRRGGDSLPKESSTIITPKKGGNENYNSIFYAIIVIWCCASRRKLVAFACTVENIQVWPNIKRTHHQSHQHNTTERATNDVIFIIIAVRSIITQSDFCSIEGRVGQLDTLIAN